MSDKEIPPETKVDAPANREGSGNGAGEVRAAGASEGGRAKETDGQLGAVSNGRGKKPLIDWRKIVGPVGVGDILAILGIVGNVITFVVSLQGIYIAIIGFISCLFLLIWGLLERKHKVGFFRALALLAVILAPFWCAYFAAVAVTILAGEPPRIGDVFKTEKGDIELKGDGLVQVADLDNYAVRFIHRADYVQTIFSVVPGGEGEVEALNLFHTPRPQDRDKVLKTGETIEVKEPAEDFVVQVALAAELKRPTQNPTVKVRVEQNYAQQSWLWRFRKWVYDRYS